MNRLVGRTALISGAAGGMGAAHAQMFIEEGANVVIGDVRDFEGERLAADLGDSASFVHLDVQDFESWDRAVKHTVTRFGGLDVLVNNAGVVRSAPIDRHSVEDWDLVIAVNLTGAFYGIRASVEALKASGCGSIINVSSDAGLLGYQNITGYNAAKFGLRGLTKNAALDLGKYNIRVNTVHPGLIRTPMVEGVPFSQGHVPLGRLGHMDEISRLLVFLASEESSFSTGAEFVADGGESAGAIRSS